MYKTAILALSVPLLLSASAKPTPTPVARAANKSVAISATLYDGKDAVREQLGAELGATFIVVKVELTPQGPKPLLIDRDDFLLRSYNNGQKCQPFAPSQIAGRASLTVVPVGGGDTRAERPGPTFGIPGLGRGPGNSPAVGNSTSGPTGIETRTNDDAANKKEDPMLAVLEAKVLPEKPISGPVSGLLYFSLDGKHKPKDLALQYKTPAGLLTLTFH